MIQPHQSKTLSGPKLIMLDIFIIKNSNEVFDQYYKNKKLLSVSEQNKFNGFIDETNKKNYLIGKIASKIILANYLKMMPHQIIFEFNQYGKPLFKNVAFNISHCQNYVVLSVGKRANGIDIEPIKKNFSLNSSMIEMVCTENESKILASIPWNKKKELFLEFWVKKEAYLKAIGLGLHGDITNIDASGEDYKLLHQENNKNFAISPLKIDVKDHICYVAYDTKISDSLINIHNHVELF